MLNLKKSKAVLGIDIGSKTTKFMQIVFTGTEKPIIQLCKLMPSGTADETFESNLKIFLRDNKIVTPLAACSIDDPSMKIRRMELPKMPEPDMIEAIKWNLRDLVEGDVDHFTVNYSIISENPKDETVPMEIVAYAIDKKVVDSYQLKISQIGFQPFFIEPASVTLASTLDRCHGADNAYVAGVDIGFKTTLFYVIGKRLFLFSRPMPEISLEAHQKEPETFNQKLALEIQKSIDTFKVNFKMEEIGTLYLSGGGALLPDLNKYLTMNLGITANTLNPFVTLNPAETLEPGIQPTLFAKAVGLAYLQA
ncbi:MAG TPA: pilus assembly protein PilM [bacterium]|nr:pilus assembly protein PilM [bacterium]